MDPARPAEALPPVDPADVTDLAAAGFGRMLLHPDPCRGPVVVKLHRDAVGAALGPPRAVEGVYVGEIPAP